MAAKAETTRGLPLALRPSQAAAMLGISEGLLRIWVAEGVVHRPYRVRKNVVLFDAYTLASDWDRIKEQAEQGYVPAGPDRQAEASTNPWDDVF